MNETLLFTGRDLGKSALEVENHVFATLDSLYTQIEGLRGILNIDPFAPSPGAPDVKGALFSSAARYGTSASRRFPYPFISERCETAGETCNEIRGVCNRLSSPISRFSYLDVLSLLEWAGLLACIVEENLYCDHFFRYNCSPTAFFERLLPFASLRNIPFR